MINTKEQILIHLPNNNINAYFSKRIIPESVGILCHNTIVSEIEILKQAKPSYEITKRLTLSLFKGNAAFPFLGFGTLTGGTDPSAPFSASSSTASSTDDSAAKAAETTWKGSALASFNKLKLTHLLGFLSRGLKTSGQREKVVKRGLGLKETSEAVRSCGNTEEEEAYVSISDEGLVVVAIVMERELRLSLEMKLWLNCYLSIYIRDKRGFTV